MSKLKMTKLAIIAEDNLDIRELVSEALTAAEYLVFSAATGIEVLRFSEELTNGECADPPMILITDFNLPDMNGFELCEKMAGRHPSLRTICISGLILDDDHANRIGCTILPKPFTVTALLEVVTSRTSSLSYRNRIGSCEQRDLPDFSST